MQFDVWMQDNLLNSLSKSIVNFLAWSTQILPCLKHSNTASPEALKYCLAWSTQILPHLKHSNTASPEPLKYCLTWTTQIALQLTFWRGVAIIWFFLTIVWNVTALISLKRVWTIKLFHLFDSKVIYLYSYMVENVLLSVLINLVSTIHWLELPWRRRKNSNLKWATITLWRKDYYSKKIWLYRTEIDLVVWLEWSLLIGYIQLDWE